MLSEKCLYVHTKQVNVICFVDIFLDNVSDQALETLSALSPILECSLPELLGLETEEPIVSDEITINLSLYSQTVELIIFLLRERQMLISAKELFKAVKEIYLFSEQKKKGMLDREFAEWYLKNILKRQIS